MPRRYPPITAALIAANVLAFVFEMTRVGADLVVGGGSEKGLIDAGALIPALVRHQHEYWRLVTGAFLHGSLVHLFVNMYSLLVLGRFVEAAAGSRRMAVIYGAYLSAAEGRRVDLAPYLAD